MEGRAEASLGWCVLGPAGVPYNCGMFTIGEGTEKEKEHGGGWQRLFGALGHILGPVCNWYAGERGQKSGLGVLRRGLGPLAADPVQHAGCAR